MSKLKRISQFAFLIGCVIAVLALGYTIYLRMTSPIGICPINPAKPYMKLGIVCLGISLGIDFYLRKKDHSA